MYEYYLADGKEMAHFIDEMLRVSSKLSVSWIMLEIKSKLYKKYNIYLTNINYIIFTVIRQFIN